eukprot:11993452-Heterocapsa_arctica.AAC.1
MSTSSAVSRCAARSARVGIVGTRLMVVPLGGPMSPLPTAVAIPLGVSSTTIVGGDVDDAPPGSL